LLHGANDLEVAHLFDNGRHASVATALEVSAPTAVTAGEVFSVTVTAVDDTGVPDPGYKGTVTLSGADTGFNGALGHTFTGADAGSFTFTGVQLFTAGLHSVTAADGKLAPGSADLNVQPGMASQLVLSASAEVLAGVSSGVTFQVTVTVCDAYGNRVHDHRAVAFASDDPNAELPAGYVFTDEDAGSHTFTVTLNTPGPATLTVLNTDDAYLTPGSLQMDVGPVGDPK
jgi:hypothetical protein